MFSALDIAIYQTVHDFPGGAAALSRQTGIAPSSLANKANMAIDERHFSPSELLAIMCISQDFRILNALCAECGFVCQAEPRQARSSADLLGQFASIVKEQGDLATALIDSHSDGVITHNERKEITREALEVIAALQDLLRVNQAGDLL